MNFFAARKKKRRAFTLIEIMVVVAIIGLIAAMGAPPLLKALQKEGMRKALSDFQDVCFSARQQAIASRQRTAVLILPQQGRFSVEGGTANLRNGKVTSATLPEGISFAMVDIYHQDFAENEAVEISFFPDGTSVNAVLVLVGRGETEKITLDEVTGAPMVSSIGR
jgi:prepilin-type N-terminal cleavage/methylation domain-containing protein